MKRLTTVVFFGAALSAAAVFAQATVTKGALPEPEVRLPKMAKAPTIDGVITSEEWAGAAEMQKFCVIRSRAAMNAEGAFWLGRDDENLYIAITSEIGPYGLLKNVKPVGHSDEKAFWDDCMEFDFLEDWNAKRPTCLHLIVNFNGAYRVGGWIDGKSTSWEGMERFTTASSEKDGLWHFEFAIPLKSALIDPKSGTTKGVRIARNWKRVYDEAFGRQTSWSAQDGAFGTAANCPKVIFDDEAPVVRMTDLGTHQKGKGDLVTYAVAATVSNPTAKPLDLKIAYTGRPVNSQPCVFSEAFTLKPGEEKAFKSPGPVLGDEMVAFSFLVTDRSGAKVHYQRKLDFQANWADVRWIGSAKDVKEVGFAFAYYPSCNVINARVNLEKAKKRPNPTKFTLRVKTLKGETLATKEYVAAGDVTDVEFAVPDLKAVTTRTGEPKYEIVLDVPGVKDGLVKGTFYRHVFEWEGNRLGLSDTVVPPFTPLKRNRRIVESSNRRVEEEHVEVVLRDHTIGEHGLWKQVTAAGKDLLARPMSFVSSTAVDSSRLESTAEWDYDGVMKWTLTLKQGHYEPFSLEIPMKASEARLMHASVDGLRNNYCGAVPAGEGRVWDSTKQGGRVSLIGDYLPYLWVGGTLRGIAVFGENDKGWVTGVKPCVEIVREKGVVKMVLNLVQKPLDVTEPRTILLGFQATPVKPMTKGWRAKPIGTLIGATYYFGGQGDCVAPFDETTEFWDEMTKTRKTGKVNKAYLENVLTNRFVYKGKPGSPERAAHEEKIRRHFYSGMNMCAGDYRRFVQTGTHGKFVFYTNARGIEFGVNAGKTFADEWTRWEYQGRLDRDYGRSEKRDYDLDPVASFRDYAAWWYKRMIESGACQALYWDDAYLTANYSRPLCDTYRLDNGEWQPATGVFAMKELVRRCAVMQAEIGAEPMDNWVHMTNTALAPILGFAGVNYDWEDTADLQTFQDRYGRDYLLASAIGRQFGNRVAVMGYISKTTPEHLAWLERTGVGVTLCHELMWPRVRQWNVAHTRLTDWGYRSDDVDVWNYWDEDVPYPLVCTGEDCVSIAMAKKAAHEAAIVVCDWGDGGTVNVKPDCAALGISADFTAVDMETGKAWPVENGVIRVALKKHDYVMIRLRAAAGELGAARDWLEGAAQLTVSGAERRMNSGLVVYNPDVGGTYRATWLRDYAYMLEADAVSHDKVYGASRLFVDAVSTNGWGVDCVKYDGTPVYQPGYGKMGRLAVADGSPFTVAVAYLTWKATKDDTWLKPDVLERLERTMAAAPVREGSPLAYISPDEEWERAAYGFTDSVRKKGHCLFESLLLVEAERRLGEMLRAAGQGERAAGHEARARAIADAVNATFWDDAVGLFRAATATCREHDVWGSAFAVWLGVADGARADAVSRALATHYDGLVRKGQVRHTLPGVYWESATCGRDNYQDGGFWGTPAGWVAWALERTDPERVDALYRDLVADYRENGVCEWSLGDRRACNKGYPASVCLPLAAVRRILAARQAKGGRQRELRVSPTGMSPQEALAKIRAAKAAGDRSAWTVRVAPGFYELTEPLTFRPEDSGTPEAPVRWIATDGEAVFAGGGRIAGWRDDGDGTWSAPLPTDAAGRPVWFQSLYANGRRAVRARHPNTGYFHVDAWHQTAVTNAGGVVTYVQHCVVSNEAAYALAGLSVRERAAVELQSVVKWSYGAFSVAGWDEKTRELTVDSRKERIVDWKTWPGKKNLFCLENVRVGFDAPGEWFYDVTAGRVRYRPQPGESLASFEALAPTAGLVSVIRFEGDPAAGREVTDISFEGVTFALSRTDGDRLESGFVQQYQLQAARNSGGCVYAKGTRRISLVRCRVTKTENYAVRFDVGCVSNRVVGCALTDLGAGGVMVGDTRPNYFAVPGENNRVPHPGRVIPYGSPVAAPFHPCAFITVDDCEIAHTGRVNPEGCGVLILQASDCTVTHCDIHDLTYTGVSVGWTWGYSGSLAQRNTVAFNHIRDIGQGVMSDMGGIYTLGTSFGTCISNNVVHAVRAYSYGGWGLYNDEGSEGIVWENNLVYDTASDAYHQHYGRNNVLRNNILACARECQLRISLAEAHRSLTVERNIICWEDGERAFRDAGSRYVYANGKEMWEPVQPTGRPIADIAWSSNLFWCVTGMTAIESPLTGFVADPLFSDVKARDFRLLPNSPAMRLGFRPWDLKAAGRKDRR